MVQSRCTDCSVPIFLVKTGQHYKWLTDATDPRSWHCGHDPRWPVRVHHPEALYDIQQRRKAVAQGGLPE